MTHRLEKNEADVDSLSAYRKLAPGKLAEDGSSQHKGYKEIANTGGMPKIYYEWNGEMNIQDLLKGKFSGFSTQVAKGDID